MCAGGRGEGGIHRGLIGCRAHRTIKLGRCHRAAMHSLHRHTRRDRFARERRSYSCRSQAAHCHINASRIWTKSDGTHCAPCAPCATLCYPCTPCTTCGAHTGAGDEHCAIEYLIRACVHTHGEVWIAKKRSARYSCSLGNYLACGPACVLGGMFRRTDLQERAQVVCPVPKCLYELAELLAVAEWQIANDDSTFDRHSPSGSRWV